jgi:hypothetical protein
MNWISNLFLYILIIAFAGGSAKVFAQATPSTPPKNYYWIGGSGNWKDVAHWATSSGNATHLLHTGPPTSVDHVIFDDKSIDLAVPGDYIITIDEHASCANLTWFDVPGINPVLVGANHLTLEIYGDLNIEAAISNRFEGVIEFKSQKNNTKINAASPFHNKSTIRFNSPNGNGTWRLEEKLTVHHLEIISGELVADGKSIDVSGNWTVENNVKASFKSSGGTVVFNGTGSTPQMIRTHNHPNKHEFHYLEINNTGAGVELQSPVTVGVNNNGGRIIFIDGIVKASSSNILILNNKTQVSGASDISHVDGYVRKIGSDGDSEFIFPTGNGTSYRPAGLVFPNSNPNPNTVYIARYINRSSTGDASYPPQNVEPGSLLTIDAYEYWEIYKEGNPGADARVVLSWQIPVSGPVGYLGDPTLSGAMSLVVCSWNSTDPLTGQWIDRPSNEHAVVNTTAGNYSGSVRTQNFIAKSEDSRIWAIGIKIIPLPIELLYFRASLADKSVQLSWATAKEINNDFFTVEKSADGKHFDQLVQVKGAGSSHTMQQYTAVDKQPTSGVNYYRLKQTDVDGTFKYSKIAVIHSDKGDDLLQVYQPSTAQLQISYHLPEEQTGLLTIFDSRGTQIWSRLVKGTAGASHELIPIHSARGLYLVTLQRAGATIVKRVIVY